MSDHAPAAEDPGPALLSLYDAALPQVYGYLLARCDGGAPVAEDLTSETMLAAVDAIRREPAQRLSAAWLVGVARHKLVDHWRRRAREERGFRALVGGEAGTDADGEDAWDVHLDALRARATLERLGAHHRAALTLRYVDDLPVPEVAAVLDRTVHATEALLVRARAAFRRAYTEEGGADA